MIDPETNLIIRWLVTLTDHQRATLADGYSRRLDMNRYRSGSSAVKNQNDPTHALGNMLFVDCSKSLGLSPIELRGLLHSPRRHVMQSITWLALERIRHAPSVSQGDALEADEEANGHTRIDLPEPIARRMNDLSF